MGGATSSQNYYYFNENHQKGYQLYRYNKEHKVFMIRSMKINLEQWIQALSRPEEKEFSLLIQQLKQKTISTYPNYNFDKAEEKLYNLQKIDWSQLKNMTIYKCQVSDLVAGIIASKKWPNLQQLILRNSKIKNLGFLSLLNMENQKISQIQLADNKITPLLSSEIKNIPANCRFEKLLFLNLDRNKIGANGAKLLSKIHMPQLQRLYCGFGQIQNQGIKHLVKANWPKLQKLSIDYSFIGLQGHQKIKLNNWKELSFIWIGQKQMSIFGFSQVVAADWNKLNEYSIAGYKYDCKQQMRQIISEITKNRFNAPINNHNYGFLNDQFSPYEIIQDQIYQHGQEENQQQNQFQQENQQNQMNDEEEQDNNKMNDN